MALGPEKAFGSFHFSLLYNGAITETSATKEWKIDKKGLSGNWSFYGVVGIVQFMATIVI